MTTGAQIANLPYKETFHDQFEVASIKPSSATSNGHLTIKGAYGVGPNQIFGGPDWLDTDRFDIAAAYR